MRDCDCIPAVIKCMRSVFEERKIARNYTEGIEHKKHMVYEEAKKVFSYITSIRRAEDSYIS